MHDLCAAGDKLWVNSLLLTQAYLSPWWWNISLIIYTFTMHTQYTNTTYSLQSTLIYKCMHTCFRSSSLTGTVVFLHCYCHNHWLLVTTQTQGWPQISIWIWLCLPNRKLLLHLNLPYMVCTLHKIYWTISSLVIETSVHTHTCFWICCKHTRCYWNTLSNYH